uniref:Transposase n=1 Tax=Equus caballus TaxID=9796 RepID=A0A9L0SES4_HORSE
GKNLLDIGLNNDFLNITPKAQVSKAKIDKWNYINLKSFCRATETIYKMKRQSTEWEKIFGIIYLMKVNIQNILKNSYNSIA